MQNKKTTPKNNDLDLKLITSDTAVFEAQFKSFISWKSSTDNQLFIN